MQECGYIGEKLTVPGYEGKKTKFRRPTMVDFKEEVFDLSMKQIEDGDFNKKVEATATLSRDDHRYWKEVLYQNARTGYYYLVVEGGCISPWGQMIENPSNIVYWTSMGKLYIEGKKGEEKVYAPCQRIYTLVGQEEEALWIKKVETEEKMGICKIERFTQEKKIESIPYVG